MHTPFSTGLSDMLGGFNYPPLVQLHLKDLKLCVYVCARMCVLQSLSVTVLAGL